MSTIISDSIADTVERVLQQLPGDIVLGTPLGIGKPNAFINALYQRIKATPSRRLTIITALSLEKPVGRSDLERRFLEPFVARVFGDYPDLDYVKDLRAGQLPDHIRVHEFFLKTGDYLNNAVAQQNYMSTNYTFVARDMALHGVNLVAQAVATKQVAGKTQISLSSNPDLTFELREHLLRLPQHKVVTVAVENSQLPFMPHDAVAGDDFFDYLVRDPAGHHTLFAPPNMKVSAQEYAIGLHASRLVADGGTLQIGIGALGDAIAQALILRQHHNAAYNDLLQQLSAEKMSASLPPFQQGLYSCTEMFVNGLLRLIDAGIVKRQVYADADLQRLLNDGKITEHVTMATLDALRESGKIHSPLRAQDLTFLQKFGIIRDDVVFVENALQRDGQTYVNDLMHAAARQAMAASLIGENLRAGVHLHGGFFLGPRDFYQRLRDMSNAQRERIAMTRIDFINQLDAAPALARLQRRDARFMNTVMMVTLLGAAVSDGLDNGQVVSGVGGQYNFVAMAHALPDARSILMLRATRDSGGDVKSTIVWQYGHTTIPRHLRDVVITEYGIADLRGQPDAEIIKRLLAISDSRFQEELMAQAKANGKLDDDYQLPDSARHNLPEILQQQLAYAKTQNLLPDFPFGSDFTDDELAIIDILQRMKQASENPLDLLSSLFKGLFDDREIPERYLQRLGLDESEGLRALVLKKLFIGNL